ncbi:DUF1934 domain-containing protein [Evansella tamaricis]|uniref:DUF1934 domain-containing protein n=1 Tax=Evansella tamaricis TaxID=2069301 RepID=A0ABS6JMJ6_9BACI|nr:DUF1934 domain-containing protein [Evansella tamaricis]MBU9714891.1 DUF1934 domain-containing protein [Evansella tamaricis]
MADMGQPTRRSVTIEMTTTIKDGPQSNTNVIHAKGELIRKGATTFIRFEEPSLSSSAEEMSSQETMSTTQIIKIDQQEISVSRKGAVSMNQRFIQGKTTEGMYQSPYGKMAMRTNTKEATYSWDPDHKQGIIGLNYNLHLQGENAGDYIIHVKLKEDETI